MIGILSGEEGKRVEKTWGDQAPAAMMRLVHGMVVSLEVEVSKILILEIAPTRLREMESGRAG